MSQSLVLFAHYGQRREKTQAPFQRKPAAAAAAVVYGIADFEADHSAAAVPPEGQV